MASAVDFKKQDKHLYMPSTAPGLVEVPSMRFLMVDGKPIRPRPTRTPWTLCIPFPIPSK